MGSGCTTGGGSTTSILFQKLTPDTMVQYTGAPIPSLGICTGDLLSEVEAAVLGAIINYSTGVGITLPNLAADIAACSLFTQYITCCGAACDDLPCLMDIIFKALCILYTDITDLQTLVNSLLNGPYNTGCLTNLPANPTLKQIIQELILEFCILQAQVAALQVQVSTLTSGLPTTIGNFLANAIQSCQVGPVTKTGSGASFQVTFGGFTPVGGIIMYGGSIAGLFDSTGLGLPNTPACGWALANGQVQNGIQTIDMRGYKPVGVNDGTMGSGSQNAEVNNSLHSGQNYGLNAHGGEINHILSNGEVPPTPLSGSVASGTGSVPFYTVSRKHAQTGDNTMGYMCDGTGTSTPCPSNPNASISFNIPGGALTGSVAGGGNGHENRDPYRSLYFIQRVA